MTAVASEPRSLRPRYDAAVAQGGISVLGERAMHYDVTLPRRVDVAVVLNRLPQARVSQASLVKVVKEKPNNDYWHKRKRARVGGGGAG